MTKSLYLYTSKVTECITELVFSPLERLALDNAMDVRVGEDQGQCTQHHPELRVADLAILVPISQRILQELKTASKIAALYAVIILLC